MEYPAFLVAQLGGDAVEELLEIHFAPQGLEFGDHVEDGGVLALEAQALHGGLEFAGVDLASGFGVEQVEGFSELLDFVLSESGPLDFLLGGGFCSWLGSVCHLLTNLNKI